MVVRVPMIVELRGDLQWSKCWDRNRIISASIPPPLLLMIRLAARLLVSLFVCVFLCGGFVLFSFINFWAYHFGRN